MPVYVSTPATGKPRGAVIVFQEIFGVNAHIRSVAQRIAQEGYLTLAPDLFFRQGDRFEIDDYSQTDAAATRAQTMNEEQALSDIDRVIANLDPWIKLGAIGFCMGGRIAFQVACNPRVSASVCFYGGQTSERLEKAPKVAAPLLMFYAEKDELITQDQVALVKSALQTHSKPADIIIYPDVGHGFFCDARDSYNAPAAGDAWKRTIEFFGKTLVSNAPVLEIDG